MKINSVLFIFLLAIFIAFSYRIIFYSHIIAGGDYLSLFPAQLEYWKNFAFFLWGGNGGLGGGIIPLLSYASYSSLMGLIGMLLGNNSVVIEKIFWWIPFLVIGFVSSFLLSKMLFKNTIFSYIAPLIYLVNTYILLIIGGGQIAGIGQAYSFAPFIVLAYIKLLEKPTITRGVVTGIALAISIMFDLRMTYVLLVGIGFYILVKIVSEFQEMKNIMRIISNILIPILISGIVAALLHAFWLIPMAIVRQNPLQQLGGAYDTLGAVKFFSFAKFEDAFGLLHPNWPENIFGFTHFMRPEFLVLPLLAYGSLLFINRKQKTENKGGHSGALAIESSKNKILSRSLPLQDDNENVYVLFFALLGLLGTFLAKGANDPFGGLYLWMFAHIPGFIMFRDPTKWYLLIVLSYSMLIPYTVGKIYEFLQRRFA